jgi:hypothetical protein
LAASFIRINRLKQNRPRGLPPLTRGLLLPAGLVTRGDEAMADNLTRLALALSVIVLITAALYQFGGRTAGSVDFNDSNIPAIHIPQQAPEN